MLANVIKKNHLVVRPINFDIEHSLVPDLRDCPFPHGRVLPENLEVTIAMGRDTLRNFALNPSKIYEAKIVGAETWLSPTTHKSNVIIKLESNDLQLRRQEILINNADVYPSYLPHMTIVYDVPGATKETRWWVNGIITKFSQGGRCYGNTIRLTSETLLDGITLEDYSTPISTKPSL